jgi:hypothetical protein
MPTLAALADPAAGLARTDRSAAPALPRA